MVVNAVLAIGLAPFIGFVAAAIGTTLSAWVMLGLLMRGAARFGPEGQTDDTLKSVLGPIIAASLVMGIVAAALGWALADLLQSSGWRYPTLAGLVGASAVVYAAALWSMGGLRLGALKGAVRR